jgi:uncharacterized membrane protein YkgB
MTFNDGRKWVEKADPAIISWMQRYGIVLLRISVGIVFFRFGILKFFPGLRPAQELALKTISSFPFELIPETIIINGLAVWEV